MSEGVTTSRYGKPGRNANLQFNMASFQDSESEFMLSNAEDILMPLTLSIGTVYDSYKACTSHTSLREVMTLNQI